ncbi:MAG: hypothetical protein QME66_03050 [Candidatus Eisenbacteria bacterium]|nr:hypothetical protein [Candidatus Eisenbacteria bacterium]
MFLFKKALFLLLFVLFSVSGVEAATDIIINAGCDPTVYQESGLWQQSVSKTVLTTCASGSRVTDDPSAYATFRPNIPSEGIYDVYAAWGDWKDGPNGLGANALNVTFKVHGMSDVTFVSDQKTSKCTPKNCNQWVFLCRMEFYAGTSGYIKVSNTSNGKCYTRSRCTVCPAQFVVADAVKLTYVGPVSAEAPTWGVVKALYR